jgi:hypothetical protein
VFIDGINYYVTVNTTGWLLSKFVISPHVNNISGEVQGENCIYIKFQKTALLIIINIAAIVLIHLLFLHQTGVNRGFDGVNFLDISRCKFLLGLSLLAL